jgi:hypothetical protein
MTHARVLASRLADLLSHEHAAMADFLVGLADFDRLLPVAARSGSGTAGGVAI